MLIPDSIATTDILGREVFAKQIVKSLTNFRTEDSESFVVGINGKWGSGKSTLLSLIQKQLDEFYQKDNNRYKIPSVRSFHHCPIELSAESLRIIPFKQVFRLVYEMAPVILQDTSISDDSGFKPVLIMVQHA